APYLLLASLAGRLRLLPRAGAWLEWVERVFGFLLLGLALYFVAPLVPDRLVLVGTVALLMAAGVVLGFLGPAPPGALRWARRVGAGQAGRRRGRHSDRVDAVLGGSPGARRRGRPSRPHRLLRRVVPSLPRDGAHDLSRSGRGARGGRLRGAQGRRDRRGRA